MRFALPASVAIATCVALGAAPPRDDLDTAFAAFWNAASVDDALKAAPAVERTGADFDTIAQRLKRGRPFAARVPTGVVQGMRGRFSYALDIPRKYDPARSYPVRIQLHGGVMRSAAPDPASVTSRALAGAGDEIGILPAGWADAPWWSQAQVDNLRAILDRVKRTYNVDENRVVLSGVSDGGTGVFYIAMRDTTPYAAFVPLNGFLMVLRNEPLVEGDVFPNNLRNKPFFIVNGGTDRLYPTSLVDPFLAHLRAGGVTMTYRPQPNAGHETSWWPRVREEFEAFALEHPRVPLPDRVTWETADVQRAGRAHWLVIDALENRPSDAGGLPDLNRFNPPSGSPGLLFPRGHAAGRVDLVRRGNLVEAASRGVKQFTLLLSPDQFDFAQPVRVTVNGRPVFDGRVERSVSTLLQWAARDNDRTMVFGAALRVIVP